MEGGDGVLVVGCKHIVGTPQKEQPEKLLLKAKKCENICLGSLNPRLGVTCQLTLCQFLGVGGGWNYESSNLGNGGDLPYLSDATCPVASIWWGNLLLRNKKVVVVGGRRHSLGVLSLSLCVVRCSVYHLGRDASLSLCSIHVKQVIKKSCNVNSLPAAFTKKQVVSEQV